MEMHIIAASQETDGLTKEQLDALSVLAGKNAGISQVRGDFFTSPASDPDKALPRFQNTIKMGHTSIANHPKIEVIFDHASRFMAMLLNNLRYYDTTERSGRYTEMTGNTETERKLYDKWNAIFKKCILEIYPDYNDAFITRQLAKRGFDDMEAKNGRVRYKDTNRDVTDNPVIARHLDEINAMLSLPVNTRSQENARYILSIFSKSTTFGYTASLDQWNFIYDWCGRFADLHWEMDFVSHEYTWLRHQVFDELMELRKFIGENILIDGLRDHKRRHFDLFTDLFQPGRPLDKFDIQRDQHIGYAYSVGYHGSFILYSHLHRHRTIKYTARLPKYPGQFGWFIPPFIRDTELEAEWVKDLESVKHLWPQGSLVEIFEAGTLDAFASKCVERLCGCAMWETTENVASVARKFIPLYKSASATPLERAMIEQFYDPNANKLKTKAAMTDGCREGCYFGCARAIDRMA